MKIVIEGTPQECKDLLQKLGHEVQVYREAPSYPWWEVRPIWMGNTITTAGAHSGLSSTTTASMSISTEE